MMNRSDWKASEEYVCTNQAHVNKERRLLHVDLMESYMEASKQVFDEWEEQSIKVLVEQMSEMPRIVILPTAARILSNAGPPPEASVYQ
jgi:hypothetical protein